jgi:hypothetical protein
MKHIKRYKLFLEENDFEIDPKDETNIKMSKEKLNELRKQISEFNSKKSTIENLYLKTENEEELNKKVESLLGIPEKRNPYLVLFLTACSYKRKLDKTREKIVNDKIKLDDFKMELKDAVDSKVKDSINVKIKEIEQRLSDANMNISKLNKDISESHKSLTDRMIKDEKDIQEHIKNISIKK